MASSGMLHHVALVRTDVSEELSASIIRLTRISEIGTTLAVTSNRRTLVMVNVPSSPILVTLMMEALNSCETSVLTRATRRNIPKDATLAVTSNRCSVRQLLVTASVVPSSPILVTLMKEALSSSKTSILTRATWRNIPEDTILHSHHCENLKSYIYKHIFWILKCVHFWGLL
jgi:hypothetical protein